MFSRSVLSAAVVAAGVAITGFAAGADLPKPTTFDDVRSVFKKRCVTCHNEDRARGDLDLTTWEAISAGSSSGPVVVPGKPDDSLVYTLAAHREDPKMPPGAPRIPQRELDLIRDWIARGISEGSPKTASAPKVVVASASPRLPAPSAPATGLEPVRPWQQKAAPTALAVHPRTGLIAVAGLKQILLFDAPDRPPVGALPFPEGQAFVLKFVQNGDVLLAGGGVGAESGKVVAWQLNSRQRLFTIGNETDVVLATDLSPDGSLVALGGPGRTVSIYRTRNGELLTTLTKHTDWILSLAFSPDGLLLASSDRFGGIQVWEANSGKVFDTLRGHTGPVTALWWAATSDELASASEDGTVRTWNMHDGSPKSVVDVGIGPVLGAVRGPSGRVVLGGRRNAIALLGEPASPVVRLPFDSEAVEVGIGNQDGSVVIAGAAGVIEWISLDNPQNRQRLAIPLASPAPAASASSVRRSQRHKVAVAENESLRIAPAAQPRSSGSTTGDERLRELRQAAELADAAVNAAEAALATQRAVSEKLHAEIRRIEQIQSSFSNSPAP